MYSFYGGRPGNSFIIIKNYESVADMVEKFKQGSNYTAVHYDEYVLINTENKNDPDNGKIYRRGYNFKNDMGGAEYIGTIVGPSGKAPMLEMTTVKEVQSKHAEEGYEERHSSGEYHEINQSLVPGKTEIGFNDTITWECCSIRDKNEQDCIAYIGFTFPYLVIDYDTSSVKPYDENGKYKDTSSATRTDDRMHPFFERWHLNIPKGIKGDSFMNLRVEAASNNIQPYDNQEDDVNNHRAVLVYDYYNYNESEGGDPVELYLGDYNIINDVKINDQGTITVEYSHNDDSIFENKIKWIKSVNLNPDTGQFTAEYNYATDSEGNPTIYKENLKLVKGITVNEDGTIVVHTTTGDQPQAQKIKWIKTVTLDNDGTLKVFYNDDTPENPSFDEISQKMKWIENITVDPDGSVIIHWNNNTQPQQFSKIMKWIQSAQVSNDGTIRLNWNNEESTEFSQIIQWIENITVDPDGSAIIHWNNNTQSLFPRMMKWIENMTIDSDGSAIIHWNNNAQPQQFSKIMKWIDNISISPDGTLAINWNNGDTPLTYNKLIRWINDISINTGSSEGEGNQKLHITWNDGTSQDIGNPINYVMDMAVDRSNSHLLVKYSDPNRRANGITYNGTTGWTDLGSIESSPYMYNIGNLVEIGTFIGQGVLRRSDTDPQTGVLTISNIPTSMLKDEINPNVSQYILKTGNLKFNPNAQDPNYPDLSITLNENNCTLSIDPNHESDSDLWLELQYPSMSNVLKESETSHTFKVILSNYVLQLQ